MTDTQELNDLVTRARTLGVDVVCTFDGKAMLNEGRRIYSTIQVVSGLAGVGSYPMSPISAAETLRPALHAKLYGHYHKGRILSTKPCHCDNPKGRKL